MPDTPKKPFPFLPLALCMAVVIAALAYSQPAPVDATSSTVKLDETGPDMLAVFSPHDDKQQAAADAHQFAEICAGASRTLERDAARSPPRLKSGIDVAMYRDDLRWATTDGWSFASRYTGLKDTVSTYLDKAAGTSPKELDDATRAKWVKAMQVIANNSEYAAERLR